MNYHVLIALTDERQYREVAVKLKYTVKIEDEGRSVMHILRNRLFISGTLVKKLKRTGNIYIGSHHARTIDTVSEGDIVTAVVRFEESSEGVLPEDIPVDILYEDSCMIALNKPPDMVTHPTAGHITGTLANALAGYFSRKGTDIVVRPVNRLDRDTSGIVVFAMNQYIQYSLANQMLTGKIMKEYIGLVDGIPEKNHGTIDLPIARVPGSTMKRHVSPEGKKCITHYNIIRIFDGTALLKFLLETGRTHQIRVHCSAIGHPLLGDTLYGTADNTPGYGLVRRSSNLIASIKRQMLHSSRFSMYHPLTKKRIELFAPMPHDFRRAVSKLTGC